jgi:hypothetical protein
MWHETFVHHTRAPLELRHPDHSKCAVVLGAIKAKPIGGRPTGRPALTALARAGDVDVWVGAKKRAARSNKETEKKMDRPPAAPP